MLQKSQSTLEIAKQLRISYVIFFIERFAMLNMSRKNKICKQWNVYTLHTYTYIACSTYTYMLHPNVGTEIIFIHFMRQGKVKSTNFVFRIHGNIKTLCIQLYVITVNDKTTAFTVTLFALYCCDYGNVNLESRSHRMKDETVIRLQ